MIVIIDNKIYENNTVECNCNESDIKWSQYTIFSESNDGVLGFNTLSCSLVFFPDNDLIQTKQLKNYSSDELSILIKNGFIVSINTNEYERFQEIKNTLSQNSETNIIQTYGVFTTRLCNARCEYCFEKEMEKSNMEPQVAYDTAAFINTTAICDNFRIHWFGGEPLVNYKAIDMICYRLTELGRTFHSTMSTNGYLFDTNLIKQAKTPWNLKRVQITIDGTENNYNRIKNYKSNNKSPYKKVMQNIDDLLIESIAVSIRLNLSLENAEDLICLVNELGIKYNCKRNISAYVHLLYKYTDSTLQAEKERLFYYYDRINYLLYENGLYRGRLPRTLPIECCMADNQNCFTIMPSGKIGKCEHHDEKNAIGDIYTGVTDHHKILDFKQHEKKSICRYCQFAPICKVLKICEIRKCSSLQIFTWSNDLEYSMRKEYDLWKNSSSE